MSSVTKLKVEYVKPRDDINPKDDSKRLARFVTIFAQVGFQELYLNPDTKIKFDYSK